MNQLFAHNRLYIVLLYLLLAVLSIIFIVIAQVSSGRVTFPTLVTSFDPVIYGMPDTIDGYPVLAVITPRNASCLPDRVLLMVLQTTAQDMTTLWRNRPYLMLERRLNWHSVENSFRWEVTFVGPGVTREQVIADYRRRDISCIRLGGPIIIACPRDVAGLVATRTCS